MAVADPKYSPGSDINYTAVTLRIRITCRARKFLITRVNMEFGAITYSTDSVYLHNRSTKANMCRR